MKTESLLRSALLVAAIALAMPAAAQVPPTPGPVSVMQGYTSLTAGVASSRVILPVANPPGLAITIFNSGAVDAFIKLGGSTVAAAVSDYKIKAGTGFSMWVGSNTYFAGITASSTTTLDIWQANGPINFQPTAGAAATTSVNQGTSPWVDNISQFGGSNVVTGTGASGAGIPRVTVANDSSVTTPSIGVTGAAVKTSTSLMGVSDGTNQQPLIAPLSLADGVNGNNSVAAGLYGYNGATWDRIRTDITNGLWVQIKAGTVAATQGTSPWVSGVTQWGGGVLGAMANYGTSPGAVLAPGVNAFVTNAPSITNITGTVSLPTGAATAAAQTGVQTTVAPGTAPASASLSGCQYVAAGVAPTDGQSMATQCGPNGRALVAVGTSGQFADTPTVQNAAYASGNCIGGFRSISVTDYNGQSGFVTNFRVLSLGGSTPTVTVYLFDANPSGSTCTDKSTFTLAAADVDKLIASPAAITLAAPTGTSIAIAANDFNPPRPFKAGGSISSGVKTIYYALVSGSTFTPATTTDIHVRIGSATN